jgi:hypothetical protein
VLSIGLQAASQIQELKTQTYFERSVNQSAQYRAEDFLQGNTELTDSKSKAGLERFIDRVERLIEESLQSNEIINVF